jgi:hypothetical protein
MSNEIEVTCRIPAPPDGWVYDGYRRPTKGDMALSNKYWMTATLPNVWDPTHCAVRAPADPVSLSEEYERQCVAREFVRFWWRDNDFWAEDNTGWMWYWYQNSSIWHKCAEGYKDGCGLTELHPRLTVRPVKSGESWESFACSLSGAVTEWRPCDQQGNPLGQERNQSQTSGGDSILPEGWTRDGKWILAPIEWVDFPQIRGRHRQDYPAELGDLVDDKDYRCVGFVDPEDEVDAFYNGEDLTFAQCMKPYSILGDWRATHAVLLEESE